MSKGYKTTEFWISLLAMVVGALLASGAFDDSSLVSKALALVSSALVAAGYSVSRAMTKGSAAKLEAAKALAPKPQTEPSP